MKSHDFQFQNKLGDPDYVINNDFVVQNLPFSQILPNDLNFAYP